MLTSFNPPGDPNTVEPAERVLARIAAQLRAADPGMTVAQATLRASEHPEFVRVNRADQERRMIKASRFYG